MPLCSVAPGRANPEVPITQVRAYMKLALALLIWITCRATTSWTSRALGCGSSGICGGASPFSPRQYPKHRIDLLPVTCKMPASLLLLIIRRLWIAFSCVRSVAAGDNVVNTEAAYRSSARHRSSPLSGAGSRNGSTRSPLAKFSSCQVVLPRCMRR